MFYRFFILSQTGPCSDFYDPIAKSDVFSSESLSDVYANFSQFLADFKRSEFPLEDLTPDLVYIVYGDDSKACPYRSANKNMLLCAFDHYGKAFRTFGCYHL